MTNETITIDTQARERTGSRYANRLRKAGRLPAVVYGAKIDTKHVSVDEEELIGHLQSGLRVVNLNVENDTETCLVKELQFGFLGDNIIHVDFAAVDLDQVVTVNVAVNTVGTPKLASEPGAMLETVRNEIEIQCKVSDIPTEILVDITEMEEAITVADLPMPPGVTTALEGDKHIIHITFVKEEEVEAEEAEVDADGQEPEVITKAKEDEGDAAASEAAAPDDSKDEGGQEG